PATTTRQAVAKLSKTTGELDDIAPSQRAMHLCHRVALGLLRVHEPSAIAGATPETLGEPNAGPTAVRHQVAPHEVGGLDIHSLRVQTFERRCSNRSGPCQLPTEPYRSIALVDADDLPEMECQPKCVETWAAADIDCAVEPKVGTPRKYVSDIVDTGPYPC